MAYSAPRRHRLRSVEPTLDEPTLLNLLDTLQSKLRRKRGTKTTLVVHGGIVSVLCLRTCTSTSDIDYIARALPDDVRAEYELTSAGKDPDARLNAWKRLEEALRRRKEEEDVRKVIKECVEETAVEWNAHLARPFELPPDWMNAYADVALPWYLDENCYMVDPLVRSAIHTAAAPVYDSAGLALLALPLPWALALKLQRALPRDTRDAGALLRAARLVPRPRSSYFTPPGGVYLSPVWEEGPPVGASAYGGGAGGGWAEEDKRATREIEAMLREECGMMEYAWYPPAALMEWRGRLGDAIRVARFGRGPGDAVDALTDVPI